MNKRKTDRKTAIFPIFYNKKVIWLRKYVVVSELKTFIGLLPGTGKEVEFEDWVVIDKI